MLKLTVTFIFFATCCYFTKNLQSQPSLKQSNYHKIKCNKSFVK